MLRLRGISARRNGSGEEANDVVAEGKHECVLKKPPLPLITALHRVDYLPLKIGSYIDNIPMALVIDRGRSHI